jgi:hypothetical protein
MWLVSYQGKWAISSSQNFLFYYYSSTSRVRPVVSSFFSCIKVFVLSWIILYPCVVLVCYLMPFGIHSHQLFIRIYISPSVVVLFPHSGYIRRRYCTLCSSVFILKSMRINSATYFRNLILWFRTTVYFPQLQFHTDATATVHNFVCVLLMPLFSHFSYCPSHRFECIQPDMFISSIV